MSHAPQLMMLSAGLSYIPSQMYTGMDALNKFEQAYADCKNRNQCKTKFLNCQL